MDAETAHRYCLTKPEATFDFPFVKDVPVFKVKDKMFALIGRCGAKGKEFGEQYAGCAFINLKCDPQEASMLKDIFPEIFGGYHMSKKHWISVVLVPSMPEKELERLIDRSYGLVVKGMKKTDRQHLERLYTPEQLYR